MSSAGSPLVSVVIPVHNGEAFLAAAVRSVLSQTYQTFDVTIVNNCSTDATLAVAEQLAASDPRVRVHSNREFLSVVDNHNMAVALVSAEARYFKVLGADDLLFPTCLEEQVRLAEHHPSVGMVTSYVLCGSRIGWDGLPFPTPFMSGREVCRLRLLQNIRVFGGPSASLIRQSVLDEMTPFYNARNYYGDNDAYMTLLQRHDFGFVHQVLSYSRRDEDSRTAAYLGRVGAFPAAIVDELTKFGPVFLTASEMQHALAEATREYYRFLGRSVLERRSTEFWHYHLEHFAAMGHRPNRLRIAYHAAARVADMALNPKRTIEGAARRLRARPTRREASPPRPASTPLSTIAL
jgi:glycosyltransferase involved in cell wall biosynthesis